VRRVALAVVGAAILAGLLAVVLSNSKPGGAASGPASGGPSVTTPAPHSAPAAAAPAGSMAAAMDGTGSADPAGRRGSYETLFANIDKPEVRDFIAGMSLDDAAIENLLEGAGHQVVRERLVMHADEKVAAGTGAERQTALVIYRRLKHGPAEAAAMAVLKNPREDWALRQEAHRTLAALGSRELPAAAKAMALDPAASLQSRELALGWHVETLSGKERTALLADLMDKDKVLLDRCAELLKDGNDPEGAAPVLMANFGKLSTARKRHVIRALGRWQYKPAAGFLKDLLNNDPDSTIRAEAGEALNLLEN